VLLLDAKKRSLRYVLSPQPTSTVCQATINGAKDAKSDVLVNVKDLDTLAKSETACSGGGGQMLCESTSLAQMP
jgi:hypothetical protein